MAKRNRSKGRQNITIQWPREKGQKADKTLQYNGQEKKVKGQTKHYNTMAKRKRSKDRQNITIQWPREKGQRADKTLQYNGQEKKVTKTNNG